MPSFETTLSDVERWELIHYIRSLRHGEPKTAAFSSDPAGSVAFWKRTFSWLRSRSERDTVVIR